jgi:Winged Helix-turn-helix domain
VLSEFPRLAPHFVVRGVPGQGLFFLSEHRSEVFVGAVFEALVPLLTGSNSIDTILSSLASLHEAAEILYDIELLKRCSSSG